MQLLVLNLSNLEESSENMDGFDFDANDGKKCVPYVIKWQVRQKGTGGARHGSKRAVQFVGGRTCFGPQPRDFSFSIPKKIVKKALSYVLRDKIRNGKVILIEGMEDVELSTKKLNLKFRDKNIDRALVACEDEYKNFNLSLRNLYNYKNLPSSALNVYDLLDFNYLLLDKKSLNKLKEVL